MAKYIFIVAGICFALFACSKEETGFDKADYYGSCNSSHGLNQRWHFIEYAINDTALRIPINDILEFTANNRYSWNDSINKYYSACENYQLKMSMSVSQSPYGTLWTESPDNIYSIANSNWKLWIWRNSQTGDNYYFWGERLQ
jgi:hypothetical protein